MTLCVGDRFSFERAVSRAQPAAPVVWNREAREDLAENARRRAAACARGEELKLATLLALLLCRWSYRRAR